MEKLVAGVLLGIVVWIIARWNYKRPATRTLYIPRSNSSSADSADRAASDAETEGKTARLMELAAEFASAFEEAGQPADLIGSPGFKRCVDHLDSAGFSDEELLGYYTGVRVDLSCAAIEALSRRDRGTDLLQPLLRGINGVAYWTRFFVLRCLNENLPAPRHSLIGEVLVAVDGSWGNPVCLPHLTEFVAARIAANEKPTFGERVEEIKEEQASFLLNFLPALDGQSTAPLVSELQAWLERRIDVSFLNTVGRVWDTEDAAMYEGIIAHPDMEECVTRAEEALLEPPRRSVLLVGESGVGKSAIIGVLGRRLKELGWIILQSGHTELMAGQIYHGQLEERLQNLVRQIGGQRRVLWIVRDFHRLAMTGKHQYSPASALDFLLPYIESGEVTIAGEVPPSAYERLIQENPRCRTALEAYRVDSLPEGETLDLARTWAAQFHHDDGTELIPGDVIQEAWSLTTQYLWSKATPGNLLQFLALTAQRLINADLPDGQQATVDDLLITLSQLTGLPEGILDDRQGFDLDGLRELFHQRVMGQTEAVDCLVERVAMIKAGVTDPTRPQGVFLFAGPTGTGKTEIAKTLAEFLFGSPDRMIRLDMSEFQDPTSINRILGEPEDAKRDALVDMIRKDPFSVVLLDEFEKANWNIWSLFLQVFDDGRLTDRWGRTADFRHAIIILTSNLGGAIRGGTSLGFTQGSSTFSGRAVQMAIGKTFSKEFINRIDRIVVFRPLSRDVMRRILTKELDDVFRRRGLRNRAWAVEWDASAIEFLLEQGFTVDLGARPLKRAVERYFLTPLATTIVKHQFPEGDQFLFVRRSESKLAVEFIDPDAPELEPAEAVDDESAAGMRVEDVVFNRRGTNAELDFLRAEYRQLKGQIESEDFKESKRSALAATGSPGFWNSPDRFSVLGRAEYLDRIESGIRGAGSLIERLTTKSHVQRQRLPRDLLVRLAQTIYLIRRACVDVADEIPNEAFLLVEAGHGTERASEACDKFARRLGDMYKSWAQTRGMRVEILKESGPTARSYRLLLAVSGFAAYSILAPENGLHLLEIPKDESRTFKRLSARVRVISQPEQPADGSPREILAEALRVIESAATEPPEVVRRYREEPSPLVRDSVRGWRTGLLDRVLGGDFDLIAGRE